MKKMHSRYEIKKIAETVSPTEEEIQEIAVDAVYEDLSTYGKESEIWAETKTCIDETVEEATGGNLLSLVELCESVDNANGVLADNSATQGQVLTADGGGGVSFTSLSGGTKLYGHTVSLTCENTSEGFARTVELQFITKSDTAITTAALLKSQVGYASNKSFSIFQKLWYDSTSFELLQIDITTYGGASVSGNYKKIQYDGTSLKNFNITVSLADVVTEIQ